jgi:hypothetical protein
MEMVQPGAVETSGGGTPKSAATDLSVAAAVGRLTWATCTFPEHIDREGLGWSKFRTADVCLVLGEVERLQRKDAPDLVAAARYAEGALAILANHFDLMDLTETVERAISDLRRALGNAAPADGEGTLAHIRKPSVKDDERPK